MNLFYESLKITLRVSGTYDLRNIKNFLKYEYIRDSTHKIWYNLFYVTKIQKYNEKFYRNSRRELRKYIK